jgi:hypothetical protein
MRALVVYVNRWTRGAGNMSRVTYGRTVLATLPTLLPQSRWICGDGIPTGRAALGAEHEAGGTASYTTASSGGMLGCAIA